MVLDITGFGLLVGNLKFLVCILYLPCRVITNSFRWYVTELDSMERVNTFSNRVESSEPLYGNTANVISSSSG